MIKSNKNRFIIFFFGLIAILIAMTCYSINIGEYPVSVDRVLATLFGMGDDNENLVIWVVRMPRTATAVLVGICLSVAGAVM